MLPFGGQISAHADLRRHPRKIGGVGQRLAGAPAESGAVLAPALRQEGVQLAAGRRIDVDVAIDVA